MMKMGRISPEERKKRTDQVADMVLTGYTYTEIAHKLGIARRSVVNYMKNRRLELIDEMQTSVNEQLADYEAQKQKRIKILWTTALDPATKKSDRNNALRLLQNEEVLSIRRKQLVGMLPPEAPAVAIQNTNVVEGTTTIADSIRRNYPELIEQFKKNKARLINDNPGADRQGTD